VSVERLSQAGLASDQIDRVLGLARVRSWDELARAASDLGEGLQAGVPLRSTIAALDAMGLGGYLDLDLGIVRGLAYYTGTVFELFDARGELRAICGGGRYDNLLAALGGVDLPALGFGMGDVVLGELLRDRGLAPAAAGTVDVFLAAIGSNDLPPMLALGHELREAGLRVEYALAPQAVGKQLKLADSRGARVAVVIGPDDRARGEVMLKDLAANTQSGVPRDRVVERVAALTRGDNG